MMGNVKGLINFPTFSENRSHLIYSSFYSCARHAQKYFLNQIITSASFLKCHCHIVVNIIFCSFFLEPLPLTMSHQKNKFKNLVMTCKFKI